jgi:HSP20 family protein
MLTNSLVRRSSLLPSILNNFITPWNDLFDESNVDLWNINVPAANIEETKDSFKVSLAAPGMKKDDFKVDIVGDQLTISSEKKEEKEEKDATYSRREYNYSSFCRTFTLPEGVIQDKIDAKYEDGLLKLTLPKSEE